MKLAFVYVTDERGFELATHSAVSLALSQRKPCDIHVFCYQFSPTLPSRLSTALAKLQATMTLHSISDKAIERHHTCGHVTKPSLLKISAIERLASHYDRIVYIDNDMLVFGELAIEYIDLGTAALGAVVDMDLSDTGALRASKWSGSRKTGSSSTNYFNVGFLVVECGNWRGKDYYAQYAAALDKHDRSCDYKIDCTSIEQCALNKVFDKIWFNLPTLYNMQTPARYTKYWRHSLVRHYCGMRKFLPVSMFRSDGKEVSLVNRIRRLIGAQAPQPWPPYEVLFRANSLRKLRDTTQIRRFLHDIDHVVPSASRINGILSRSTRPKQSPRAAW